MLTKKIKSIKPRSLSSVQIVDNDLSSAIRIWKKMLKENNTIEECYERKFYNKPSNKKRLEKNTAIYFQQKEAK